MSFSGIALNLQAISKADVTRKFNGEEDVAAWLDRLELVAGLQEVDDLAAVIPMFLEGPAYDVYSHLSVDDKESDSTEETAESGI